MRQIGHEFAQITACLTYILYASLNLICFFFCFFFCKTSILSILKTGKAGFDELGIAAFKFF